MKIDYTMDDFRAEMQKRGVYGRRQVPDVVRRSGHAPKISLDRTRITGCTCGWRTPPGTTDSDDAYSFHAAMTR